MIVETGSMIYGPNGRRDETEDIVSKACVVIDEPKRTQTNSNRRFATINRWEPKLKMEKMHPEPRLTESATWPMKFAASFLDTGLAKGTAG